MLHPASVSTLRRKQRADCSPRVFLRGLHTPAAGPQPTERQGLRPSRPKGLFTAYLCLIQSNFSPSLHPSIITSIWFLPRLLSLHPLWLDLLKHVYLHLELWGNVPNSLVFIHLTSRLTPWAWKVFVESERQTHWACHTEWKRSFCVLTLK